MRFKVNEIGDNGLAVSLPVTAAWMTAECPDVDARPAGDGVTLRGHLQRTGNEVFLRGDITGALEMPCARCLESARVPVAIPLAVTFFERPAAAGPGASGTHNHGHAAHSGRGNGHGHSQGHGHDEQIVVDAADEDVNVGTFDGDEVDLTSEVRDEILLALPVSPLCAEDCLGLCPVCGNNRNQSPCDCEARQRAAMAAGRSPLAALGKLKI